MAMYCNHILAITSKIYVYLLRISKRSQQCRRTKESEKNENRDKNQQTKERKRTQQKSKMKTKARTKKEIVVEIVMKKRVRKINEKYLSHRIADANNTSAGYCSGNNRINERPNAKKKTQWKCFRWNLQTVWPVVPMEFYCLQLRFNFELLFLLPLQSHSRQSKLRWMETQWFAQHHLRQLKCMNERAPSKRVNERRQSKNKQQNKRQESETDDERNAEAKERRQRQASAASELKLYTSRSNWKPTQKQKQNKKSKKTEFLCRFFGFAVSFISSFRYFILFSMKILQNTFKRREKILKSKKEWENWSSKPLDRQKCANGWYRPARNVYLKQPNQTNADCIESIDRLILILHLSLFINFVFVLTSFFGRLLSRRSESNVRTTTALSDEVNWCGVRMKLHIEFLTSILPSTSTLFRRFFFFVLAASIITLLKL